MKFIQKHCTHLNFYLLIIFLFAMCGCSSKHAWFNPGKNDLATKQDVFSCEEKAANFSKNMGKPGNRKIVDQHMNECMESLDYKWVPEESIQNMKKKQATSKLMSAVPLETTFPYCTDEDADWCGSCWSTPENTWCCKQRGGERANCGIDSSTCKFCAGCHDGDECTNICVKPPKGAGGSTNIKITNATNKEVKFAFVTGAEGGTDDTCKGTCKGACPDKNKMISYQWVAENTSWCKNPTHLGGGDNAGFCIGTVAANSSVELKRPETGKDAKCLTGSIQLGGHLSCPDPTGFTQGEFTLNPTATDVEGVDISLVNGANYALTINLPGKAWKVQDNGPGVTTIGPSEGLTGNNNKYGIFPPGCTDCTSAIKGKIPCPDITPEGKLKCSKAPICNVYRGGWTGGTVEFVINDLPN